MAGPLEGVRVVEMGGIGPVPFTGMMLADNGAEVLRVDRPGANPDDYSCLVRSRRRVVLDLKTADHLYRLKDLLREADVLLEGFRPGVMERLGLGPDEVQALNPRLVYGRMTGWGQTGPLAHTAGHDINYISLSGALHATGRRNGAPVAPPALIGDFGGGGMLLAFSVCAALLHARQCGQGQVIDCSMTEGAGLLMTAFHERLANGTWKDVRGANFIDSGSHFYEVYETADKRHISIGAIEPKFYGDLRKLLGLDDPDFEDQWCEPRWPELKAKLAAIFRSRTRDEWCELLGGTDACFAPVLSMSEAPHHPHAQARGSFVIVGGVTQPAPTPRYGATPLGAPHGCEEVDATRAAWHPRK